MDLRIVSDWKLMMNDCGNMPVVVQNVSVLLLCTKDVHIFNNITVHKIHFLQLLLYCFNSQSALTASVTFHLFHKIM